MDVADVDFHDGDPQPRDRVPDRHARVRIACGIHHHAVAVRVRCLKGIDQFTLHVALEQVDRVTTESRTQFRQVVFEAAGPIDGRFPGTEQVQVGAVENEDARHCAMQV